MPHQLQELLDKTAIRDSQGRLHRLTDAQRQAAEKAYRENPAISKESLLCAAVQVEEEIETIRI